MPYIKLGSRGNAALDPQNAGELNYAITSLIDEYLVNQGLSYVQINKVIGVLECAKLELYRRVAAPYEDTKITENGDVYIEELITNG